MSFESFPLVSVVVPTFNRLAFLRETVDSILSQTYPELELIIVDNMSVDGTEGYVSRIGDGRVRYYRNANGGVVAVNRNYGARVAFGKYLAFCDDDDLWRSRKLERQVALLEQCPDVALCYTNGESFRDRSVIKRRMQSRNVQGDYFVQLLRGNYIPNSSVVMRLDIFRELGMLTTIPSLREDYDMWLRVAHRFQLRGIDEPLIRYRLHAENAGGNLGDESLRAIRTLKNVGRQLCVNAHLLALNIAYWRLKYLAYRILGR